MSFSRGSRGCLGINLAYAEIFLAVGTVLSEFEGMTVWNTVVEDVHMRADYYIPAASGRGVGVLLG